MSWKKWREQWGSHPLPLRDRQASNQMNYAQLGDSLWTNNDIINAFFGAAACVTEAEN
jgi:hypothetical protein